MVIVSVLKKQNVFLFFFHHFSLIKFKGSSFISPMLFTKLYYLNNFILFIHYVLQVFYFGAGFGMKIFCPKFVFHLLHNKLLTRTYLIHRLFVLRLYAKTIKFLLHKISCTAKCVCLYVPAKILPWASACFTK